jgi:site-specific recombinase XerD
MHPPVHVLAVVERGRARGVPAARRPGGRSAPVRAAQLRHAHAVELAREGVPLNVIQRQLGHANLGTTSIYLQGIDTEEIIATVHARRAPMMSATAGLRL